MSLFVKVERAWRKPKWPGLICRYDLSIRCNYMHRHVPLLARLYSLIPQRQKKRKSYLSYYEYNMTEMCCKCSATHSIQTNISLCSHGRDEESRHDQARPIIVESRETNVVHKSRVIGVPACTRARRAQKWHYTPTASSSNCIQSRQVFLALYNHISAGALTSH